MPKYLLSLLVKEERLHTIERIRMDFPLGLTDQALDQAEKSLLNRFPCARHVEITAASRVDEGPVPTGQRLPTPHLNECGTILPPVDSPLLIEIAPGVLLNASRPAHVPQRDDQLMFDLDAGGMYIGRPLWTHA